MTGTLRRFSMLMGMVSGILIGGCYSYFDVGMGKPDLFKSALLIIILFYIVAIVSSRMLVKARQERPQAIIRASMMVTVVRFMVYLIVLITFLWKDPENAPMIAILFFSLYLTYTVLEKVFIINKLQKPDPSNK